jgi:predicted lipid-binding transport protein (Tim44 family)
MLFGYPTCRGRSVCRPRADANANPSNGLGSAIGAALGGLLVGLAPAAIIKLALGGLLIWSAWKIFAHRPAAH